MGWNCYRPTYSLDGLIQALQNGPVIAGVDEGFGGHIVVVTGYQVDVVGNKTIIFNEPYYPYVMCLFSGGTCPWPATTDGLKNRTLTLAQFHAMYTGPYITFTPPGWYSSDVRQNTYLVD